MSKTGSVMRHPDIAWRLAYWSRASRGARVRPQSAARVVAPRLRGFVILLASPALLLVPFDSIGVFSTWREGSGAIIWLFAFTLAAVLGCDSGRPGPASFWIYQKGGSLVDFATRRWALDAALGVAIMVWCIAVWVIVSTLHADEPLPTGTGALAVTGLTFLIAHAALFPAAAAGWSRGVDLLVLLALVALLEPLLFGWLPSPANTFAHWALPPFLHASQIGLLISDGEWTAIASEVPHVLLFIAACCVAGALSLRRWRP